MDFIKIVQSKLSVEEISNEVSSPNCGAVSLFMGTTRDTFEDKKVVQLEYEAYEPMAIRSLKAICEQIRGKWSVHNIAIYHRLGIVPVQEASIVIAISSPHRVESLEAVHYAIDEVKTGVPIWKKEIYDTKLAQWKENKEFVEEINIQDNKCLSSLKDQDCLQTDNVLPHLIQIKADSKEIKRRIDSFIELKREQVNLGNVQDFCYHGQAPIDESSCARVDALLVRRKDSKSHLRVRRVLNSWGPQTRGGARERPMKLINCSSVLTNHLEDNSDESRLEEQVNKDSIEIRPAVIKKEDRLFGIEERLRNAEEHLHLHHPISQDTYERLKKIEERILYLEGLSPEYFKFWDSGSSKQASSLKDGMDGINRKRTYSSSELARKLQELEYKVSSKAKNLE